MGLWWFVKRHSLSACARAKDIAVEARLSGTMKGPTTTEASIRDKKKTKLLKS